MLRPRCPHRCDLRRVSVCQAIVASFLALDANRCSIDCSLVGSTVEGDLSRTAGRRVVPDELNASDSLATWPLPNRLEIFLSQRVIRDCSSVELDHAAAPASLATAASKGRGGGDGTSKRQRARAPIQKRNLATDFRSLAAIGHWLERPYHLPLGKVN